jgi:hypothetical protein
MLDGAGVDRELVVLESAALAAALVWAAQASARRSAEGVCPVSLRMTRQRWR